VYQHTTKSEIRMLRNRLHRIANKVDTMTHYWKTRCEERNTYIRRLKYSKLLIERLEIQEKHWAEIFNRLDRFNISSIRSKSHRKKDKLYLFFCTHNQANKLRQMLSRSFYEYVIRQDKNLVYPGFTHNEYHRLKTLLKKRR
jgi:hypothetical protein